LKTALVTGADGFIGSHLVEYLLAKGHKVRALSQYNSFNFWGWLEDVKGGERLEIVPGDIRDPGFCEELCGGIDTVYHLAALIAIPYSYKAPHSYVDTNVVGTMNMCSAALKAKAKRFVHTSTSEVYGTALYTPIDEKHPLQPQSPYSASKIAADAMAQSFFNAFDLPLVVARPFNTYGPRQSARAIIPTIITQMLNGATQVKLGSTTPVRDFNFVKDTCEGFYQLANQNDGLGEIYNIGSGVGISVAELFELLKDLTGSNAQVVSEQKRQRPEKSEVHKLICDANKLKALTGHKSATTLRDGLANTIEWFRSPANLAKYKADIYNV
jgi:NAD dependent epimerase/dehydratase